MNQIVLPAIYVLIIGLFFILATCVLCGPVSRIFQRRFNNITIGVVGLLIFVVGKYVWYIIDFINNNPPLMYADHQIDPVFWQNLLTANLGLVFLPDLLLLLMSLALVFDKTHSFPKIIAPYGLFFGLFYLFCSSFGYFTTSYVAEWNTPWYELIFVGDGITRIPAITFIYLSLISLVSIISTKEYTRWSITSSIVFGLIIIAYSAIFQIFKDVGANGLTILGYSGLSYNLASNDGTYFANYFFAFGQALQMNADPKNLWIGILTIYGLLVIFIILIFVLKNLLTRDLRRMKYIYYPWYHRSRIFKAPCSYIDGAINNFLHKFTRRSYLFGINPKDLGVIQNYLSLLMSSPYTGNVDIDRLKEYVDNLEIKKNTNNAVEKQKKQKQKKQIYTLDFYNFEQEPNENKQNNNQDSRVNFKNNATKKQPNITMKWTDENGTTWSLDNEGKYYYFANNQWIAY